MELQPYGREEVKITDPRGDCKSVFHAALAYVSSEEKKNKLILLDLLLQESLHIKMENGSGVGLIE